MTLQVIGAGFGRTGTASLKLALETLLGGSCYHMSEVLGNAGHVDQWLAAAAGKPDWPAIFANFVATVDFPASNYTMALAEAYPDAKIVLSVRDAEKWFQSTQETILSRRLMAVADGSKWRDMLRETIDLPLGGDINDHDAVVGAYHAHIERVQAAFGPERLLTFEAKQGWAPLCEFLEVDVPAEPYPHINSKEEFDSVFALLASPIAAAVMNGDGMGGSKGHDELFDTK